MSNNKIKLVVEVDEYCRDAIIRHRNGTYGAQLPYYIISSAFEAIANGTSITEGDLIMFRTLMTEIANKGLPFEEVLLLIDNAKTTTEEDCISREYLQNLTCGIVDKDGNIYQVVMLADINNAPPVDPVRPKGEWIYKLTWDNVHKSRTCNKCGYHEVVFPNEAANFCPNCGAKMKGGAE